MSSSDLAPSTPLEHHVHNSHQGANKNNQYAPPSPFDGRSTKHNSSTYPIKDVNTVTSSNNNTYSPSTTAPDVVTSQNNNSVMTSTSQPLVWQPPICLSSTPATTAPAPLSKPHACGAIIAATGGIHVPNPLPPFKIPSSQPVPAPPVTSSFSTNPNTVAAPIPTPAFSVNLTSDDDINGNNNNLNNSRRQKRLERNRESARLSRRRRKHYLEVLEERVSNLSDEMDRGRRDHVRIAISKLSQLRGDVLQKIEEDDMKDETKVKERTEQLRTKLSRMCDELKIAATFQKEQIRSLVVPAPNRFILWLTLQNDSYYRGGRAVSERLSAARIGERMLANGNDRAAPSGGMWPLFCNEINLSYDQEERVRNYQRKLLMEPKTWVDVRHTTKASSDVIEKIHGCMNGLAEMTKRRENQVLNILTVEQRAKFLLLAKRRKDQIGKIKNMGSIGITTSSSPSRRSFTPPALEELTISNAPQDTQKSSQTSITSSHPPENPLGTSSDYHIATNLYMIDKKLQTVFKDLPSSPPLVSGNLLKRLSRRPSFESLASTTNPKELSRENSSSSLKRSSSSLNESETTDPTTAANGNNNNRSSTQPGGLGGGLTPASAQAAALPLMTKVLQPAGIVPVPCRTMPPTWIPPTNVTPPTPQFSFSAPLQIQPLPPQQQQQPLQLQHQPHPIHLPQQHHQQQQHIIIPHPTPVYGNPFQQFTQNDDIVMNVVPEDREFVPLPSGPRVAEEFLLDLAEEGDWAIEGFDLEMSDVG